MRLVICLLQIYLFNQILAQKRVKVAYNRKIKLRYLEFKRQFQETADVTHSEDYLVLTPLKNTALRELLCASSRLGKFIQALDIWVHFASWHV